ncbi:hypothetical protein SAMN03159390_00606 [Pseudomonas sp. NFACC49-2]|uniref:hypothetical protein n=1 Tax=Pseudomonas sp. NFACC49-2 TaxID=1566222 RepID=UPI00091B7ABA|nr:hypothetical protein [Pseudomonas sp. NFACC49-2]SFX16949.1 hypothetical protein SAMN03159390_00606 [Pseudomonas sp. NFACC49-2]
MIHRILKSRKLRAYGSVIDLLPSGDYSEHMPKRNQIHSIEKYWINTGKYLGKEIEQHDKNSGRSRIESDCQTA